MRGDMRVQGKGEAAGQRIFNKGLSFTPEYHLWGYLEHVQTFGIQTRSGDIGLTIVNTGEWIFEHGTGIGQKLRCWTGSLLQDVEN